VPKATLLLYPGAGSDSNHSSLLAVDDAVRASMYVERRDFPYRKEGRKAPDRAPKLMASVREDLKEFSRRRGLLVMGGRSMGGRMASMVAADVDGGGPVARLAGLVLISYPLHPPGKPEKLRTGHFADIGVPCLFISGTKDTFGSPDEFLEWTPTIAAPVEHVWIEGKGHDLKRADDQIVAAIEAWLPTL